MGQERVRRHRWTLWLVLFTLTLVTSCTWSSEEPGLFGRATEPPSTAPTATSSPTVPRQQAAELPVVGEQVWTSADGLDVQVRIAVHALRRIPGASVLDWSVTPLIAPGLRVGDAVPMNVDLGLNRWGEDDLNVFLVDAPGRRLYRPLTRIGTRVPSCLCSPLRMAQRQLRLGHTTLLQITYPALPRDVTTIDVDVTTVPMFFHVPVTPSGMVPLATSPGDLARPAEPLAIASTTRAFSYAPGGQSFLFSVDQVVASTTFTSVRWTIQSLTPGAGLQFAASPPFTVADATDQLDNPLSASGPQVSLRGRRSADLVVRRVDLGRHQPAARECLCTDFRIWTSALRGAQAQASVVTNLPPLPLGAQEVSVTFPGLTTLTRLPLTSASDGSVRSAGPTRRTVPTYPPDDSPRGWTADRWPTPVPDSRRLGDYASTVDRLVS